MAGKKVARATRWVILGEDYHVIDWGYGVKEAQEAYNGALLIHKRSNPSLYFEDDVALGIEYNSGKSEKSWQF